MTTPHKWADVIKAWADGKEVQCAHRRAPEEWISAHLPNFYSEHFIWRIKPETVKYRRYLWEDAGGIRVYTAHGESQVFDFPYRPGFIRWIDHDWQEVEV